MYPKIAFNILLERIPAICTPTVKLLTFMYELPVMHNVIKSNTSKLKEKEVMYQPPTADR